MHFKSLQFHSFIHYITTNSATTVKLSTVGGKLLRQV